MILMSPLEQFEVTVLKPFVIFNKFDFSITNVALYSMLIVIFFSLFSYFATYNATIIPTRWQYLIESLYDFVFQILKQQLGTKGQLYFPLALSIFGFILTANLIGMTPYSFTVTSHIIATLTIGLSVFIGITLIGVLRQKMHFLDVFVPSGIPKALVVPLICIEIISYIIRPISLSVRLFANLMAGHTLLNILSGFTYALFKKKVWMGIVPFIIILAVTGLELTIAFLQAYVFIVLLAIYFSDAYSAGH